MLRCDWRLPDGVGSVKRPRPSPRHSVMPPSEKRPAEASSFLLRRQQVLATQCSTELRRCAMEHELRVTDLRFHERRYHRILSWLDDVRGRHSRTADRRRSVDLPRKAAPTPPGPRAASQLQSMALSTPKIEDDFEEVFITRLPELKAPRQAEMESERRRYDALLRSTRKDPLAPLPKSDQRRRLTDPKARRSLERKRMAVLPVVQTKSTVTKAQLRRQAPLSAIPEADLTEERVAADLQAAKARKRALLPKVKVSTPCSTPHSSRTPALSPISELPPDAFSFEEEEEE